MLRLIRLAIALICYLLKQMVSPANAAATSTSSQDPPFVHQGRAGLDIVWPANITTVNRSALLDYTPTCIASGNVSPDKFKWVRPDMSHQDYREYTNTVIKKNGFSRIYFPILSITHNSLRHDWTGTYYCEANGVRSQTEVRLTMFSRPKIKKLTYVDYIPKTSEVVYRCCTAITYPPVKMFWQLHSLEDSTVKFLSDAALWQNKENNTVCGSIVAPQSISGSAAYSLQCVVNVDTSADYKRCLALPEVRDKCKQYLSHKSTMEKHFVPMPISVETSTQSPTQTLSYKTLKVKEEDSRSGCTLYIIIIACVSASLTVGVIVRAMFWSKLKLRCIMPLLAKCFKPFSHGEWPF